MHLSRLPYVPHALSISFFLILSPKKIFGDQFTSQSSSLRGALNSPVTSYLTPYQQKIRALIRYETGNVFLC